jgi:glycosyltransferase involved in cell wall biosynthesis
VRILTIAQFYPPIIGGEERMARNLSVELARRGHSVSVATLWHDGQPSYELVDGVAVHRIRSLSARLPFVFGEPSRRYAPPFPDPGAAAALRSVVTSERPDVVHAHNWLVHSFLPIKRSSGAALVMSLHDYSLICSNKRFLRRGELCNGPGPAKCLLCSAQYYGSVKGPLITAANALTSLFERSAVDLFLPVSNAVASTLRLAEKGLPYRVMPNFIPEDAEEPLADALPALPTEFILFVGDVTPDKGVVVLLEAHSRLRGRRLPLVLAGRCRHPELLPALAEDVQLLGPLPHHQVLAAWRRATVAVVPSLVPDAFPVVALEAMASGRPVIASRIGGLPDAVVDGETGILVRSGDVGELTDVLERVLSSPELRARLGQAGRERARLFSPENVLPQVEQAYEDARERRRAA